MNDPAGFRRTRQRGATLLVGMLMLLMVMLVVLGVVRLSMRHTQVVNNEQVRLEATTAANYALDLALNQPQTAWSVYAGPTGQTQAVNLGNVQMADSADPAVSTAVAVKNLACRRGRVLNNQELMSTDATTGVVQVKDPLDEACIFSASNNRLTFGSGNGNGNSLCASVLWEMQAQAVDTKLLAATATVTQGVEVRTDIGTYSDACK